MDTVLAMLCGVHGVALSLDRRGLLEDRNLHKQ
jgi:hypothetical protein